MTVTVPTGYSFTCISCSFIDSYIPTWKRKPLSLEPRATTVVRYRVHVQVVEQNVKLQLVVLSIILLPALTVLVTVDKVFEQLLAGQLEPLSNKFFVGLNSACRKRYSWETTLVRLVEDWKRFLDNNHTVWVLSADMSKAFDCLSPNLLLSKLQAYGLCRSCSNSLALLKSYFTNRKNRVRLGDTCGEWKAVKRGCPKGSSLGPVLWNFYQNDLFYENVPSQLSAYADDHQIYISGEKIDNVDSSLEEDGNTTGQLV